MARVGEISDGTLTVDLIDTTSPGIIAQRGGFGSRRFMPHSQDELGDFESKLFTERWRVNILGSSQDNVATQTQNLYKLLRKAWRYHNDATQRVPVYLKVQATNETNARWALVHSASEITVPDLYDQPFESSSELEGLGIAIHRFIWRSGIEGTLPGAVTVAATDGADTTPEFVFSANFRDDADIDTIWIFQDPSTWSGNQYGTAGHTILNGGVGDIAYLGGPVPFHHLVFNVGTAGVFTADLVVEYWDGAWTAIAYGTKMTIEPLGDEDELFKLALPYSINLADLFGWATTTINGANKYWIRIRINSVSSWTTDPANATYPIYVQRTPYVEIPSGALHGDVPSLLNLRIHSPDGGDQNEGFPNISRIIIGVKHDPGVFESHLNAGGDDNPSGWATAQGTDATATADPVGPGGKRSNVTFSGDATLIKRVTLTGTAKLGAWIGEYRAFLRIQQSGGAAGDVRLKLVTYVHDNQLYSTKFESPIIPTAAVALGAEIVEFGKVKIPLSETTDADGFTSADLIFEIHAERTTGAATLGIYDLILIPVDYWSVELDDPITDSVNGNSALRGLNFLEVDGGIIADRTLKYIKNGANNYISEAWSRGGPPPHVEPQTQARLYFLIQHYPFAGTWGSPPLLATLGCELGVSIFTHHRYLDLRGSAG